MAETVTRLIELAPAAAGAGLVTLHRERALLGRVVFRDLAVPGIGGADRRRRETGRRDRRRRHARLGRSFSRLGLGLPRTRRRSLPGGHDRRDRLLPLVAWGEDR